MGITTRRNFLSLFGAAAAGGATAVVAGGDAALAASGTMQFGVAQDAGGDSTTLVSTSTNGTFRAVNNAAEQWAFVGVGDYLYGGHGDRSALYATAGETGIDITGGQVGVWAKGGNIAVQGEADAANLFGVGGVFSGRRSGVVVQVEQADPDFAAGHLFLSGVVDPFSGSNRHFGELAADGQDLWFCTGTGTPGTWRTISGAGAAGAFHAITPARVYDSRLPAPAQGVMSQGDVRTVSVAASRNLSTGAVVNANIVPQRATAVTYNITVTNTVGGGWLAVNPGGNSTVSASTINWSSSGQALANGTVVPVNANREITLICGRGSTHVIIDVTGYYR